MGIQKENLEWECLHTATACYGHLLNPHLMFLNVEYLQLDANSLLSCQVGRGSLEVYRIRQQTGVGKKEMAKEVVLNTLTGHINTQRQL